MPTVSELTNILETIAATRGRVPTVSELTNILETIAAIRGRVPTVSKLTNILQTIAAGGGVPTVAAAPPLRRDRPRQAVLFRGVERLLRPSELRHRGPGSSPLPDALLVDVVARQPELGASTARARN